MAGDGTGTDPSAEPIGRVRLDDAGTTPPSEPPADDPDESGWSLAGVGVAVLVVALMIGALVIILWAAFQARA